MESNVKSKTKTHKAALAALERTCSKMERTKSDARRYLYKYGILGDEAENIIKKLEADKYIDESRYSDCFVREKINLQMWSKRRIAQTLLLKNIPKKIIDNAIENNYKEEVEEENLSTILKKRLKKCDKKDDIYTIRRKLFTYVANKGYDIDLINDTLNDILKDE